MQINHVEIPSHPSQKSFLSQDKQQMLERIGEEAEAPSHTSWEAVSAAAMETRGEVLQETENRPTV